MAYYTTNITIFRDEFINNPILHNDEWYMMLWRYYCTCCATIIEFATIIQRDATTKLRDFDVNMFFASILIYGSILMLVWIFLHFIVGLLKDATKNKDTTENTNTVRSKTTRIRSTMKLDHRFLLCRRVR